MPPILTAKNQVTGHGSQEFYLRLRQMYFNLKEHLLYI